MRALISAQGRKPRRRHWVPEGQYMALCGFMPSFCSSWALANKKARVCINCHQLLKNHQGIDYSKSKG